MSLLHYITYKLVVIRDRRIGSIYYAIAVLIVLYTLGEIFIKKGYLEVGGRVFGLGLQKGRPSKKIGTLGELRFKPS